MRFIMSTSCPTAGHWATKSATCFITDAFSLMIFTLFDLKPQASFSKLPSVPSMPSAATSSASLPSMPGSVFEAGSGFPSPPRSSSVSIASGERLKLRRIFPNNDFIHSRYFFVLVCGFPGVNKCTSQLSSSNALRSKVLPLPPRRKNSSHKHLAQSSFSCIMSSMSSGLIPWRVNTYVRSMSSRICSDASKPSFARRDFLGSRGGLGACLALPFDLDLGFV